MQSLPLPDSAPILLFLFHCDSCWDRLLGDHIPGTKKPSWCGPVCQIPHPVVGVRVYNQCMLCLFIPSLDVNNKMWLCTILKDQYVHERFFYIRFFFSQGHFIQSFFKVLPTLQTASPPPFTQNHSYFPLKCCFSLQTGRVGPMVSHFQFFEQIRITLFHWWRVIIPKALLSYLPRLPLTAALNQSIYLIARSHFSRWLHRYLDMKLIWTAGWGCMFIQRCLLIVCVCVVCLHELSWWVHVAETMASRAH